MIISGCGASVRTGQYVTQPSRGTRHRLDKQDLHFLHSLVPTDTMSSAGKYNPSKNHLYGCKDEVLWPVLTAL